MVSYANVYNEITESTAPADGDQLNPLRFCAITTVCKLDDG